MIRSLLDCAGALRVPRPARTSPNPAKSPFRRLPPRGCTGATIIPRPVHTGHPTRGCRCGARDSINVSLMWWRCRSTSAVQASISSGSFSKAESYVCASPADMEGTNRSQFRQPIWRTTVSKGRWRCCTRAQNPIANLISVPFQNHTNFPVGKYARVQNVFNVDCCETCRMRRGE